MVIIRKAELADIHGLTDLLCEMYNEAYDEVFRENELALNDRKQVFFLAFDEGFAVGCCQCSLRDEYVNGKEYDGTAGYLEAVYVRPKYRRRYIASDLVKTGEDWVRSRGCREMFSDCGIDNMSGYNFHLRAGFNETERNIMFRKELASVAEVNCVFSLRPMKQSDIDDIPAQYSFQNENNPRSVYERYFNEQQNGERVVIVACVDGKVAGYVSLYPQVRDAVPFRGMNIPEIKDFSVFKPFRGRGIGTALMDAIEAAAAQISDAVCLGVGLYADYGSAQRMYARRGYVPDGSGIWSGESRPEPGSMVRLDDDLIIYMSKKLR